MPVHAKRQRSRVVNLKPGEPQQFELELEADAHAIKLWWPNGVGAQPLYAVNVTFTPTSRSRWTSTGQSSGGALVSTTRRIGFRYVALVTGDDTNASYVSASIGQQGTSHVGMAFRVNGALASLFRV